MHDVACEFARAAVRSKDAQKQLARTSLTLDAVSRLGTVTLEAELSREGIEIRLGENSSCFNLFTRVLQQGFSSKSVIRIRREYILH